MPFKIRLNDLCLNHDNVQVQMTEKQTLLFILGEMNDCDVVLLAACMSHAPSPQLAAGVFNLSTLSGWKETTSSSLNSPQSAVGRCKMIRNPPIVTNLLPIWILLSDVIKRPAKWIRGHGCIRLKRYWISVLCGIARDQAKWFCLVVIVTAYCVRSFFVFLWLSYSLCHSFTFQCV